MASTTPAEEPQNPIEELSQLLDDRRKDLDLTWDEVADRAKVNSYTIRRARGSGHMADRTARKLEKALELEDKSLDPYLAAVADGENGLPENVLPEAKFRRQRPAAGTAAARKQTRSAEAPSAVNTSSEAAIALFSHLVRDPSYRRFVGLLSDDTVRSVHEKALDFINETLNDINKDGDEDGS